MSQEPAQRPRVAGMYEYLLGGAAATEADRAAGDLVRTVMPDAVATAWANRGFLQRAVLRMARDWGLRQFVDLGAGLPTQRSTHEVAGGDARVVYVDNDPEVVQRGRRSLAGLLNVQVLDADVREPDRVLDCAAATGLIDLDRPLGLLMTAVVQFIPDADDPWRIVARYLERIASGSYLALSAPTADHQAEHVVAAILAVYRRTNAAHVTTRTRQEVERFFTGLRIVPPYPGAAAEVGYVGQWGAEDPEAADDDSSRWMYAAVGCKP